MQRYAGSKLSMQQRYIKMHNRNLDVPSNFVVPAPPHIEHDSDGQSEAAASQGVTMHGHGPVSKHEEIFIEQCFKISANLYSLLFRATLGATTGSADEGYPSQREVLERKKWSSKTSTVGCTRLQLDTKAGSKEKDASMIRPIRGI